MSLTRRPVTLVLRPEPDLSITLQALRANGVEVLGWASLGIEPINVGPTVANAWVQHVKQSQIKLIFVSRNAVRESAIALRDIDRKVVQCICVGNGTAQALAEQGFSNVTVTNQQGAGDSEQLLALPSLSTEQLKGSVVIVVQGEGGRNLIAPTLTARAANVHSLICYRRRAATSAPGDVIAALEAQVINRLVTYSVESWQVAASALAPALADSLRAAPTFCSHPRVAARLHEMGAQSTFVFDGSVEDLLKPTPSPPQSSP
jgi:uroporphyrinogen-III synthase